MDVLPTRSYGKHNNFSVYFTFVLFPKFNFSDTSCIQIKYFIFYVFIMPLNTTGNICFKYNILIKFRQTALYKAAVCRN
ncbi:hypothetical protein C7N43_31515 [Sphingobacteriales bacterium UPWRP_1]|nr:hypothetical protein B6N25_15435 [Sphingobacteriales bacterium TSM_CSS]PSJ72952.1 hypothetical protein C7N43_31515 [Sphingobacteriales bacterium UPWRP_1]